MPKVNPSILRWARETAGLTLEEAVQKLNIHAVRGVAASERLAALEKGEVEPSRPLLVRMAKQYRRPLLTFYMSAPPRKGERGQDFRTLPEGYSKSTEALLDALIRDIRARQSMIKAIIEDEEAEPLEFVGSTSMSAGVNALLSALQSTLDFDRDRFRALSSPNEAFSLLRSKAEDIGVFILLIGDLGSYHTTFEPEVFRGFVLADSLAPFIVINDNDSRSAWSFTLVHELVHLWLGQTGISGMYGEMPIERFCNDVASEFLLPSHELRQLDVSDATKLEVALSRINEFAKQRHVSGSMVAYKLYRAGLIGKEIWRLLADEFRQFWLQHRAQRRKRTHGEEGGPSYYVVRQHRIGKSLLKLVQRLMAAGELTTSKAGKVLGVKAKNVQTLFEASQTL